MLISNRLVRMLIVIPIVIFPIIFSVRGVAAESGVKNIIFLIGDGMGVSYTSAYRYLKDNPETEHVELTAFDQYLIGQQTTYPGDPKENVTDSAASATAMSTGEKTYNSAIAVGKNKKSLKTVLEAAKEKGMATGLVATAPITHGTPAAFGAHNIDRDHMNAIADDYYRERIDGQHKIDVLLGGGEDYFIRKDHNLVEDFKRDGYSYVKNLQELKQDKNSQVLGLFAKGGLPKMIDRPEGVPSLADMTVSALERLNQNSKGFFLMVEGSQIDWAGHDNDIVGAMSEMEDFEKAFIAAIEFAKKDGQTLVIATADHSTGGYTIGARGEYNWFSKVIKGVHRTPDFMAELIVNGAETEEVLSKYIDFSLTKKEVKTIKRAAKKSDGVELVDQAIEDIINKRSYTGWTTDGHTGEDVNVYAYGPGSEQLKGQIDNTDQAKTIFNLLK